MINIEQICSFVNCQVTINMKVRLWLQELSIPVMKRCLVLTTR